MRWLQPVDHESNEIKKDRRSHVAPSFCRRTCMLSSPASAKSVDFSLDPPPPHDIILTSSKLTCRMIRMSRQRLRLRQEQCTWEGRLRVMRQTCDKTRSAGRENALAFAQNCWMNPWRRGLSRAGERPELIVSVLWDMSYMKMDCATNATFSIRCAARGYRGGGRDDRANPPATWRSCRTIGRRPRARKLQRQAALRRFYMQSHATNATVLCSSGTVPVSC